MLEGVVSRNICILKTILHLLFDEIDFIVSKSGDDFLSVMDHDVPMSPLLLEQCSSYTSRSTFTNHSQDNSLSFSSRFVNLNVTQVLIGKTVRFSQSEVVLHSNAAKCRKI